MFEDLALPGSVGSYIAIGVFLVCFVLVVFWEKIIAKKEKKVLDTTEKYAVLTREDLDALPDEELVRAVVSDLIAKEDASRPDPLGMIIGQSRGRQVVYSVWMVCNSVRADGLAALMSGSLSHFAEFSLTAFAELGAEKTADVLREAITVEGDKAARKAALDALDDAFKAAEAEERPLDRCVPYIRDLADEFVDDAEEE